LDVTNKYAESKELDQLPNLNQKNITRVLYYVNRVMIAELVRNYLRRCSVSETPCNTVPDLASPRFELLTSYTWGTPVNYWGGIRKECS